MVLTNPDLASIPFDRRRSGFIMGEEAAALILEELSCAQRCGAKIYGEIVGYGATCDAFNITRPKPDAIAQARCMENALLDGELVLMKRFMLMRMARILKLMM